MKKDYNTKKKAAIAALSIVAVCLAGGLFYYIGTMGGQPQEAPVESTAPAETQVVVPEITTEPSSTPETQAETEPTPSTEPAKATGTETENSSSGSNTQDTTQSKPSDGKPKSPSEATPPSSPQQKQRMVPLEALKARSHKHARNARMGKYTFRVLDG